MSAVLHTPEMEKSAVPAADLELSKPLAKYETPNDTANQRCIYGRIIA